MAIPVSANEMRGSFLRWIELSQDEPVEMEVQMLRLDMSLAVVESLCPINTGTRVLMVHQGHCDTGRVQSCKQDGKKYIVAIHLESTRDPGVFTVDSFLSEEDEQRILDEIAGELDSGTTHRLATALNLRKLLNFTMCWSRASRLPAM